MKKFLLGMLGGTVLGAAIVMAAGTLWCEHVESCVTPPTPPAEDDVSEEDYDEV